MATERCENQEEVLTGLRSGSWGELLDGVRKAVAWIRVAMPGDPRTDEVVSGLVGLANHDKWEVRRAVAQAASVAPRAAFGPVLARLMIDANARVRQAATEASLRARDGRGAGVFGKEHGERINASLDSIQAKYGIPGREAVKRTAERMTSIFARELYHEVIKLVSPLGAAAQRLQVQLRGTGQPSDVLIEEAARIASQVKHLELVLNAMRSYAAVPALRYAPESVRDVCGQAVHLACGGLVDDNKTSVNMAIASDCVCEIDRSRIVQALTNVLVNALESYEGVAGKREPIEIQTEAADGSVTICVRDSGAGMSPEVLRDAPTLFSTGKRTGTGFGLPLAIKIVESEHGGKLLMSSQEGLGTEVRVILPLRQVEAM